MTFFGKGRRDTIIDGGTFNCPHCRTEREYVRKTRTNALYLFGVMVKPLDNEPDLIECVICGQGYNVDVLSFKPSGLHPGAAKLIGGVKAKLSKGYPPDYVLQDLIDQGIAPEVAGSAVQIAQKELNDD